MWVDSPPAQACLWLVASGNSRIRFDPIRHAWGSDTSSLRDCVIRWVSSFVHQGRKPCDRTTIGIGRDGGLAVRYRPRRTASTRFEGAHARAARPRRYSRPSTAAEVRPTRYKPQCGDWSHAGSAEQIPQQRRAIVDATARDSPAAYHRRPKKHATKFVATQAGALRRTLAYSLFLRHSVSPSRWRFTKSRNARALEGELAELEDAWREADEISAIADDMFLPSV